MSGMTILERFIERQPLAVMTRCVVAAVVDEHFDTLFQEHRRRQYDGTIKFSVLALSMADITLGLVENRNQAYHKYQEELKATKAAYYGKINRCEPSICEAVVQYSAERATVLAQQLAEAVEPKLAAAVDLPGYRCYTLDGNHLQKTEKRLKETRGLGAAPLPGTVVARYDHQTRLFDRVYLLEDAHAQESTVLQRVLDDLQPDSVLLADRHFCIVKFLLDVAQRGSAFLIRQHGRLKGKLLGQRRYLGPTASGEVFEQALELREGDRTLVVRRITVCLKTATRDGDVELHLLSNVPESAAAAGRLADLYRRRWQIENAFHVVTMTLHCEAPANGYPRAALLQFCMALVAYNCRQVLMAALLAEHKHEDVANISQLQMALDMVRPLEGLLTAISAEEWQQLTPTEGCGWTKFLRRVAAQVPVQRYRKSKRGPKKPAPPRQRCRAGTHVSTAKLLASRKQRS